jgi:hypothetical protein
MAMSRVYRKHKNWLKGIKMCLKAIPKVLSESKKKMKFIFQDIANRT